MSKRKDVVLKCLLRKIRKTIKKHFLKIYWRSIQKDGKSYNAIKVHLKKYIYKYMNKAPTEALVEDLAVFIWFEKIEASLNQIEDQIKRCQLSQKIRNLRDVLYKFNFSRFLNIIQNSHLSEVILHFENIQDLDSFSNNEKLGFKIISDEWIKWRWSN